MSHQTGRKPTLQQNLQSSEKSHNFREKNTIFNERRVYNPTFRLKKKFLCAIVRISACVKRLGSKVIQIKRLCFIFSCRKSFRVACMACFPISLCTYQSSCWYSGRLDMFKEEVVSLYNIHMKY